MKETEPVVRKNQTTPDSERVGVDDRRLVLPLLSEALCYADGLEDTHDCYADRVCMRLAREVKWFREELDQARRIAEEYRRVWEMVSDAIEETPNHDPLPWQNDLGHLPAEGE